MKKLYELELTRHGVTPAQFLAYVRQMCKRHDIPFEMSARDFANGQSWGNDTYMNTSYTGGTPSTRPAYAETCKALPYDYQTYIRGFDGSVYNEIIEFQFDDESTGFGYFFTVSTEADCIDDAAAVMHSAINYHRIAIERNGYQIERKAHELAEVRRNIEHGWATSWAGKYAEILEHEITALNRENDEHRAAIEEARGELKQMEGTQPTQEAQEAPETAPAAEAEQQPTETENAPQAATQAAEGTEITAITYTTDDDPDPAPGLLIHRPGTTRGIIIGEGVMLPDDPADMLTAYGEREYSRDAAGNYIITA